VGAEVRIPNKQFGRRARTPSPSPLREVDAKKLKSGGLAKLDSQGEFMNFFGPDDFRQNLDSVELATKLSISYAQILHDLAALTCDHELHNKIRSAVTNIRDTSMSLAALLSVSGLQKHADIVLGNEWWRVNAEDPSRCPSVRLRWEPIAD